MQVDFFLAAITYVRLQTIGVLVVSRVVLDNFKQNIVQICNIHIKLISIGRYEENLKLVPLKYITIFTMRIQAM